MFDVDRKLGWLFNIKAWFPIRILRCVEDIRRVAPINNYGLCIGKPSPDSVTCILTIETGAGKSDISVNLSSFMSVWTSSAV